MGIMDKKKLEAFKKRLETRQQELRRTVNRTQADGRSADEDTAQDIADRWIRLSHASAKAASANAFTAAKRSTPSAWKPSPGRATASSVRKSWSRGCWRKLRAKQGLKI